MAWTTPGTAVAGAVLSSSFWNEQVRDNLIASPRGVLGKSLSTSSFNTSATHTTMQDTGLSASVTYEANRVLRLTCTSVYQPFGGLQAIDVRFVRGSTTINTFRIAAVALDASNGNSISLVAYGTVSSAATETFKVQMAAATANTAVSQYADSQFVRQFIVEDMGLS